MRLELANIRDSELFEDSNAKPTADALKRVFTEGTPVRESKSIRPYAWSAAIAAFCLVVGWFAFEPAMMITADCAVGMHKPEVAGVIYDALYSRHPNNFDVLRAKARLEAMVGNYHAALKDDDAAIAVRNNAVDVYANRGFVRYKIHDDPGAVKDFSKVIVLEPTISDIYVRRGVVYARLGEFRKALNDYDRAMVLDPSNAEAASFKAWALDLQSNASMEGFSGAATTPDGTKKLAVKRPLPPSQENTIDELPKLTIRSNSGPTPTNFSGQTVPGTAPRGTNAPRAAALTAQAAGSPMRADPTDNQNANKTITINNGHPAQISWTNSSPNRTFAVAMVQTVPQHMGSVTAVRPPVSSSWSSTSKSQSSADNGTQTFGYGFTLQGGGSVNSGPVTLSLQRDGDLVLSRNYQPVWSAHIHKPSMALDCRAQFQDDGNLVLFGSNNDGTFSYWSTGTQHSATAPHSANTIVLAETEPYMRILDNRTGWIVWAAPPVAEGNHSVSEPRPIAALHEAPPAEKPTHRGNSNQRGFALLLSPGSAPSLVLTANSAEPRDNMRICTAPSSNVLEQKWVLQRKTQSTFVIHPAFDSSLALTVVNGKFTEGSKVIVAVDHGYSSQHWVVSRVGRASFALRPLCAPGLTLDSPGGSGTQPDLLRYSQGNLNTIWILRQVSY
jgi:hypothetical protein